MFWPCLHSLREQQQLLEGLHPIRLTPTGAGQHRVCLYTSVPSAHLALQGPTASAPREQIKGAKQKNTLARNSPGEGPCHHILLLNGLKSSRRYLFNNNIILKLRNALSSQHILCTSDSNDLTATLGISLEKSCSSPAPAPWPSAGSAGGNADARQQRAQLPPGAAGALPSRRAQITGLLSRRGENKREPRCAHPGFNGSKDEVGVSFPWIFSP